MLLTAFGLRFRHLAASAVSLPFVRCGESPGAREDVTIRLGNAPERLDQAHVEHGLWSAAPDVFLLRDPHVGGILVRDGTEIVLDPLGGADPADLRMFLCGSVMAALLQQRSIIPFHASAVRLGAGAVLFAGASGAGKSSLLAEFTQRGQACLSDDVVGVTLGAGGCPLALPSYPATKLWEDTIAHFALSQRPKTRLRSDLPKHMIAIERFEPAPCPMRAVILLTGENAGAPALARLSGADAFAALQRATYRKRMLQGLGRAATHFALLSSLLSQIPVFALSRGPGAFSTAQMADAVLGLFTDA
ncbi:MAG: hypothetical protein AAF647_09120 [Pseudomonadota bacterium]